MSAVRKGAEAPDGFLVPTFSTGTKSIGEQRHNNPAPIVGIYRKGHPAIAWIRAQLDPQVTGGIKSPRADL